jgi:hypothetical protein
MQAFNELDVLSDKFALPDAIIEKTAYFPYSNQIYEFSDIVILTVGSARPDRDEGEVLMLYYH